jgi:hypothetical protein
MKNKIGIVLGFALGVAGFLLLFKIIFLVRIAPSDELAPGIVVGIAILCGLGLAFIGSLIQDRLSKKSERK